jgi:uncharacterized membrane protein YjgN (DUF898 family)
MTTLDATVPAAQPGPAVLVRVPGPVWFIGREKDYWQLMIRGAMLLGVTLGIYRFWLTTDQRRFLWSNTEVLGQTLEYTGTARELLIGFLIAIAILIPIYGLIFMIALDLGLIGKLASVIGFVLLTVIGHYAVYRARRYRLTRTVYRGVRFHQTGSAWLYAFYASLWSVIVVLTIGLAYPFMEAVLERYKMRNTWLGNLQGRFDGTGMRLLLRGFFMWLVTLGPLVGSIIAMGFLLDKAVIEEIMRNITDEDALGGIVTSHPGLTTAIGIGVWGLVWPLLIGPLLYPVFQAMVLRWWASGLRFGEVTATSKLRTGEVYMTYLRFIGWSFVFGMITGIMGGMLAGVIFGLVAVAKDTGLSTFAEIGAAIVGVAVYMAVVLGYSTIYQVKVKLGLWRAVVESLDIANPQGLENVTSVGAPASPVGEGLADALNVGSF